MINWKPYDLARFGEDLTPCVILKTYKNGNCRLSFEHPRLGESIIASYPLGRVVPRQTVRTIERAECVTIKMVAGNEKRIDHVIDGQTVKHWVGIGWIDIREATKDDYQKYPVLID